MPWTCYLPVTLITCDTTGLKFYKTNPENPQSEWFDFSSQGKTDTGDTPQPDSPADLPSAADLFNKGISIQGEQIILNIFLTGEQQLPLQELIFFGGPTHIWPLGTLGHVLQSTVPKTSRRLQRKQWQVWRLATNLSPGVYGLQVAN